MIVLVCGKSKKLKKIKILVILDNSIKVLLLLLGSELIAVVSKISCSHCYLQKKQ